MYATVRSKTLINRLFHLGICVSYERCLYICNVMAPSLLEDYNQDKVFIANTLKLKLFTIIAKDNIDLNASSTKVKQHFHGISMTTMQFPSKSNPGVVQETLYNFGAIPSNKKLKLPDEYICLKEIPYVCNTPLFTPVSRLNVDYITVSNEYNLGKNKKLAWLEIVSEANNSNCNTWSKFHSNLKSQKCNPIGINALMPLINEKVSSIKSQYHCMKIIRDTTNYINPDQIPVDVSDQPVYAFSKEVQLRYPSVFGPGQYLCMLGDLHIEHSLLIMRGEIIKGSGLESILERNKLPTLGTSTVVDANDIKRSRYCLQVALCAIYKLLKDAHIKSNISLSPLEWLDEMSKLNQVFLLETYLRITNQYPTICPLNT